MDALVDRGIGNQGAFVQGQPVCHAPFMGHPVSHDVRGQPFLILFGTHHYSLRVHFLPSGRGAAVRHAVVPGVTLAAVFIAVLVTRADPDLWGHLRFGADIVHTRSLPSIDPYSFTSDRPWVNHEWASEVLFALVYAVGGGTALILLKVALIATVCLLLVGNAKAEAARGRALVFIGGLTVAAILPRASQLRPQLLSVFCFAVLISLLRAADRGHTRRLIWVPLLMVLWANAHGGWLVGCATTGCWAAGVIWTRRREGPRAWIAPAACAAGAMLATLATPYGLELWAFLHETVGPSRAFIAEWGPITGVPPLLLPWIVFWALAILALRRGGVPANPALAVIPVAWGVASARVSRLDTFFALSVLACLAAPIGQLLERPRGRADEPAPSVGPIVGVATVVLAIVIATSPQIACIEVHGASMPEPQAIQFIRERQLRGRMITFFDWGQYAIWYLPPGLRISMDGRRETVYTAATIDAHLDLYEGFPAGLAYARQLNPDYIWLPREAIAIDALRRSGWTSVFDGPASIILAREAGTSLEPLAIRSNERPSRCFPGP
jgi:hypothetical protein